MIIYIKQNLVGKDWTDHAVTYICGDVVMNQLLNVFYYYSYNAFESNKSHCYLSVWSIGDRLNFQTQIDWTGLELSLAILFTIRAYFASFDQIKDKIAISNPFLRTYQHFVTNYVPKSLLISLPTSILLFVPKQASLTFTSFNIGKMLTFPVGQETMFLKMFFLLL